MKKREVFPVENVGTYFIALRHLKIMTTHPMEIISGFPVEIAVKSSFRKDQHKFLHEGHCFGQYYVEIIILYLKWVEFNQWCLIA